MSCGSGDLKFRWIWSGWGGDDDVKAVSIRSAQSFVNQFLGFGDGSLSTLRRERDGAYIIVYMYHSIPYISVYHCIS